MMSWNEISGRGEENDSYLSNGKDFIDEPKIAGLLDRGRDPDPARIRDIISRSLSLARLEPGQTAALLNVKDPGLWEEIFEAAAEVKNRVYGPRVVTFAPLYLSNLCVNSCLYCSFRRENGAEKRRRLSLEEVRRETEALVAIGHKRLIIVLGEHPDSDIDYMTDAIRTIYGVKEGSSEIRRVNVNAAPLSVAGYRVVREAGIGTYQVFQETYHRETYGRVHPRGPKADYRRRLYALHRAQEAGVDDVAIGALFGLYDWRFEVMGLLMHAIDLEEKFDGVGPHTISFPRLKPAAGSPFSEGNPHAVNDEDFFRLVAVLRLSVPYTGMIVTAREPREVRRRCLTLGCTQTDASTKIGIGAYSEVSGAQDPYRQQFTLQDERSLEEVIREIAELGFLTSFCTSGYRNGRTGKLFMKICRGGKLSSFCMPNAVLTFKEYLLDYASKETAQIGNRLIEKHIESIPAKTRIRLIEKLKETEHGARDLLF